MQVLGQFKRFWGSQDWSIKIDFLYEKNAKKINFTNLTVEFKNKSKLSNSFEVHDLCSCVQLMSKFTEGFGIAAYDRRLANWLGEYFNENGLDIDVKVILKCLKKGTEDKIDVKVKKMNIVHENFTDILEYNPDDLLIDFETFYDDSKWEINKKDSFAYPLNSMITCVSDKEEKQISYSLKTLENSYNGFIEISNVLTNDKEDVITDIVIEEQISSDFKPYTILASLIAPDKTVLGVFQPLSIKKENSGLHVSWKIDELKIGHQVKVNYLLKQRVPFILHTSTDSENITYLKHIDINSPSKFNFLLAIPALVENNVFSRKQVNSIEAFFPVELETQSILYLYPHYILKIIDQGHFQKVTFSELFIDALFFDQVQLEGSLLPVISLYESILPHIGSKLVKKIFRLHSFSHPLIIYNFETSSIESIEIHEQYQKGTQINLLSLGSHELKILEIPNSNSIDLNFLMNATNNTVKYTLAGDSILNLEKSLEKVKIKDKESDLDIEQHMNVESIIDKSNNIFKEIARSNIHSEITVNKMRLRSFNLKITEKIAVLESTVNHSDLDKAFEALQNEEALTSLKSKIKSSYETKFINETGNERDFIAEKPAIEVSTANEQEIEENLLALSDDVESTELTQSEMDELNDFINDFDDSKEFSPTNASVKENDIDGIQSDSEINVPIENQLAEEEPNLEDLGTFETIDSPLVNKEPIIAQEQLEEDKTISKEKKTKKKKGIKKKKEEVKKQVIEDLTIEIVIIYENSSKEMGIEGGITTSSIGKVKILNKNSDDLSLEGVIDNPDKIYLKIPKNDRYIILLINPNEDLASHIYGRWKDSNYPKFKMLTRKISGSWHLKMQLLESGETFDLTFKTV